LLPTSSRLGEHQREHRAVGEAERLQHRELAVRSRTDCAMVLPATSSMVKNTAARMAHG
jgi:hypothetical protein